MSEVEKMKAAVVTGVEKIEILDRDVPKAKPGWVLTKVLGCGICGSDVSIWYTAGPYLNTHLGHEYCLEIVDPSDSNFKVGDRVVGLPTASCLECPTCLEGRYNICRERKPGGKGIPGIGISPEGPGAFSKYFLARSKTLHKIPDHVSTEAACLSEPLSFAISAVTRRLKPVEKGEKILVSGAGVIGTLVCEYLKSLGAYIGIIDLSKEKCDIAIAKGIADVGFCSTDADVMKQIQAVVPDGWDSAYECTGKGQVLNLINSCLKQRAEVVQAGISIADTPINNWIIVQKELVIYGAFGSSRQSYEASIDYISKYPERLEKHIVKPNISIYDIQATMEKIHTPGNVELKYIVNPQL